MKRKKFFLKPDLPNVPRTEWFPIAVRPKRVGWYEVAGMLVPMHAKKYWTGKKWMYYAQHSNEWSDWPELRDDYWRGLTRRASTD